jgi:acetyl-CoA C-acetyltransferase
MSATDPVVIVAAARTPLGRFQGDLSPFSAHDLGSHVIGAAVERAKLAPERIDEVLMGCVLPAGQGQAPARQATRGSMGDFGEATAEAYQFTRADQDAYAMETLTRARRAVEGGAFKAEIVPIAVKEKAGIRTIENDEHPLKVDPAKIPGLKPAFRAGGTITPAASSANADGAAALILARRSLADRDGLPALAEIKGHATHSQEPQWFTTAPIPAIRKRLEKIGWSVGDVDLFEINEAFAVVAMAAQRDLGIPREKLNINGGACALGHPIGATGARLIVTLLHALEAHNLKRGVAALCIGGGEATAIAIERIVH